MENYPARKDAREEMVEGMLELRFEGPLHPAGAVWRIELTSPRWPD